MIVVGPPDALTATVPLHGPGALAGEGPEAGAGTGSRAAADVDAAPLFPALGDLVAKAVGPREGAATFNPDPTKLIRATKPAAATDESLLNTIVALICVDVGTDGMAVPLYEPSKLRVAESVPSYTLTKSYPASIANASNDTEIRPLP